MMGRMERPEEYDWVEDPELSFDELVERAQLLEPVPAAGRKPPFQLVKAPCSFGGKPVKTVVRKFVPDSAELVQRVS